MSRYRTPRDRHMLRQPIVLVLNKNWQPVTDRNPVQAFRMMAKGAAVALEILDDGSPVPRTWDQWCELPVRETDRFIRTVKKLIRIPLVLVLGRYDKLPPAPKRVPFTVDAIWERDLHLCQYCTRELDRRRKEGNLDHIVPRSAGGMTTYENIVLSCTKCNTRKADRTPQQAGMKLQKQPSTPSRMSPALRLRNRFNIPEWDVVSNIPH
jgi:5-methylcytosine-specific restriction endonuclease McrA